MLHAALWAEQQHVDRLRLARMGGENGIQHVAEVAVAAMASYQHCMFDRLALLVRQPDPSVCLRGILTVLVEPLADRVGNALRITNVATGHACAKHGFNVDSSVCLRGLRSGVERHDLAITMGIRQPLCSALVAHDRGKVIAGRAHICHCFRRHSGRAGGCDERLLEVSSHCLIVRVVPYRADAAAFRAASAKMAFKNLTVGVVPGFMALVRLMTARA
ncbi:hypothetical protein [Burkholderia cenocepacia]|uniref:hypothetical protein n=1 Tax=Burkholderia cenocepacia TaxID=95486 RepID=UPI0038F6C747